MSNEKTITEKLLKIIGNREVLILENDFTLSSSIGQFRNWMVENKVKHNVLYNLNKLPVSYIVEQLTWFDVFSFQTTGKEDRATELRDVISKMKDRITIEAFVYEPVFPYKPKGSKIKSYALDCYEDHDSQDDWALYEVKSTKYYTLNEI